MHAGLRAQGGWRRGFTGRETHQVDFIHYLISICEGNPWSKVVKIPALQDEGEQLEKHFTLHTHKHCANLLWDFNRNVAASFISDKFILSASLLSVYPVL